MIKVSREEYFNWLLPREHQESLTGDEGLEEVIIYKGDTFYIAHRYVDTEKVLAYKHLDKDNNFLYSLHENYKEQN